MLAVSDHEKTGDGGGSERSTTDMSLKEAIRIFWPYSFVIILQLSIIFVYIPVCYVLWDDKYLHWGSIGIGITLLLFIIYLMLALPIINKLEGKYGKYFPANESKSTNMLSPLEYANFLMNSIPMLLTLLDLFAFAIVLFSVLEYNVRDLIGAIVLLFALLIVAGNAYIDKTKQYKAYISNRKRD